MCNNHKGYLISKDEYGFIRLVDLGDSTICVEQFNSVSEVAPTLTTNSDKATNSGQVIIKEEYSQTEEMGKLYMGTNLKKFEINNEPIKVLEAFAGYGSQRMALDKLGVPYESVGTLEIDIPAILSYANIHDGLSESDEDFEYPTKEEMLEYLENKNIGLDFKSGKVKLPKGLDKIKQLYRQAGNSIVVDVLYYMFKNLFVE